MSGIKVFSTFHIHVIVHHTGQVINVIAAAYQLVFAPAPEAHVMVAPEAETPINGFVIKQAKMPFSRAT